MRTGRDRGRGDHNLTFEDAIARDYVTERYAPGRESRVASR